MSSDDDDDDLFGGGGSDSDDTAELLAAANQNNNKKNKPPPKPKTVTQKQDSSSDDGGLFDSDSDQDDQPALSKKQKLENLARKKKQKQPANKKKPAKEKKESDKPDGYESGNSYDSETFERTAEDDAFIDTTGEDADAVNELYSEQNFNDERPDPDLKKKKKRKQQQNSDNDAAAEPDNPIMAAVHRMKKKKRVKVSVIELEDQAKVFLHKMDEAAERDETCVAEKRPALYKLQLLQTVCDELTKKDRQRVLVELDLLTVVKRWIQPLPNGSLGNVTIRQKLLDSLFLLQDEITSNDLRRSELGKTVMTLAKHRNETPTLKRQWRQLIENWSRPIFKKSGNMRDLDQVQRGGSAVAVRPSSSSSSPKDTATDLQSMIVGGKKSSAASSTRVSIPFSKGFAYSVRPQGKSLDHDSMQKAQPSDIKTKLQKRMVEKGRKKSKNQRSANISVEGRKTK